MTDSSNDEVRAAAAAWSEAIANRDTPPRTRSWARSTRCGRRGLATCRARSGWPLCPSTSSTRTSSLETQVHVYGDDSGDALALPTGRDRVRQGPQRRVLVTDVWVKRDGRWQVVARHTSRSDQLHYGAFGSVQGFRCADASRPRTSERGLSATEDGEGVSSCETREPLSRELRCSRAARRGKLTCRRSVTVCGRAYATTRSAVARCAAHDRRHVRRWPCRWHVRRDRAPTLVLGAHAAPRRVLAPRAPRSGSAQVRRPWALRDHARLDCACRNSARRANVGRPMRIASTLCPCSRSRAVTRGARRERRDASSRSRMTYLGVAGWQIECAGKTILVDPYFSRPALDGVIESDPKAVAAHAPKKADLIVVGHSHVDHLLDAPAVAIAQRRAGDGQRQHDARGASAQACQRSSDPIRGGEDYQFDGFSVRVIPSLHSALDRQALRARARRSP